MGLPSTPRPPAPRAARAAALAAALALAAAGVTCEPVSDDGRYVVALDLGPDVRALGGADDGAEAASAAEERLLSLGAVATPALLAALDHEPPAVRAAAVHLLAAAPAAVEDQELVARLERAARVDEDAEVLAAAVAALGDVGAVRSTTVIERALDDADPVVRLAALGACPVACSSDAALARVAALAVEGERLGPALAARRIVLALRARPDVASRVATSAATTASSALARPVRDGDATRALAALVLADLGDASGAPVLLEVLRGPASPLRVHAVHALGEIGGADSVPAIAALLGDPVLAAYAQDALNELSRRGVDGATAAVAAHAGPRPAAALP